MVKRCIDKNFGNLEADTYELTLTDEAGCQSFYSQTISEPTELAVSVVTSDESAANTNDGKVELTITGGTPDYQVSWDKGGPGTTLNNLAPDVYTYTVEDANGCTVSGKVNILKFQCQNIELNVVKVDASCPESADGIAYIELTNAEGEVSVEWSNNMTTDTIRNLAPGRYEVIVNVSNCPFTKQFDIEAVDETLPNVLTQDITVYLNQDGFVSIDAEDIDNGSFDECSGQDLKFNLSQSFFNCDNIGNNIPVSLIVTDRSGNIESSQAIVTVLDTIAPKIINCTPFISTSSSCVVTYAQPTVEDNCARTRLEISDQRFESGSVFPVGTNEVIYTLFEDGRAIDQCTIMVQVVNNLDFDLTTNEDGTTSIDISGGNGSYEIQILDANRILIENAEFIEQVSNTNYTIKNLEGGLYSVQVTDGESCAVVKPLEITTNVSYSKILEQSLSVFPNPTSGMLHLKFDQLLDEPFVVDLFDVTGKRIWSKEIDVIKPQLQFDLSELVPGAYHFRITTERAFFSKTIILSK